MALSIRNKCADCGSNKVDLVHSHWSYESRIKRKEVKVYECRKCGNRFSQKSETERVW